MEKIEIRRLSPGDSDLAFSIEAINELLKVLSKDKPNPYQIDLERLLLVIGSENFELFVLEVKGEIKGMLSICYHLTLTKWVAYIEDVVIYYLIRKPRTIEGAGLGAPD